MTTAGAAPSGRTRPGTRTERFVICGENLLTLRIVEALRRQRGDATEIVVVVTERGGRYVDRIAAAPGVRVVEGGPDDDRTLLAAGVRGATAVALVDREDVTNIDRALRVQEIDASVRLVVRLFNTRLGARIEGILPTATVLSVSETAAPSFVAQAIGRTTRQHVRVADRTFVVAGRREVRDEALVCGLAANSQTGAKGGPRLLPDETGAHADPADYVLALAESRARVTDQLHRPPTERIRNLLDRVVVRVRGTLTRRLARATLALIGLFVVGTLAFATAGGYSLGDAIYLAVLDSAGAAEPDTGASPSVRVIQALVTVVGIAIIPLVTAVVVESAVSARTTGGTRRRMPRRDHVVVVGLGNVGLRIVTTLRERGVPVVGVERAEGTAGAAAAGRAGVPVVIGDATRERVLREAGAEEARALVAVTSDDATNLQAALVARSVHRAVRVVLRLRDDELAGRVERSMDAISRSVSYVAAPVFAAALRDGQVLATIPVGRRILLMAEATVGRASLMTGLPVAVLTEAGQIRVVGVFRGAGPDAVLEMPPRPHRPLKVGDRLLVVATRGGLGTVLERCAPRSTVAG